MPHSHPNFLHQSEPSREAINPVKTHKRRRRWIVVSLVFSLCVVVYVVLAAIGIGRVTAASLDAKDALNQAQASAQALDFSGAATHLQEASADLHRAKSGLVLLAPLKILPWVGDQVRGVADVVDASNRLVPSLQKIIAIAAEVVQVVDQAKQLANLPVDQTLTYLTMPEEVRHDLLEKLHQAEPDLETARAELVLAKADVAELDGLSLAAPIEKAVEPFKILLPELTSAMDFLVPLSATLPDLAGLDATKQYLVLFENNTELRPGGGFVGNFVGSLQARDGVISGFATADTYSIDQLVAGKVTTLPPAALRTYLGVDAWYFRDSNWSPDFPTSAEQAVTLLNNEESLNGSVPTPYDGVLAVTPTFAADLLRLVGDVTIDGQTFTADNIADTLEYQVEYGYAAQGLPQAQRKEVVNALAAEVLNRLFQLPIASWLQVSSVARTALLQKQFLVYSGNAGTQEVLSRAGWAGSVHLPATGTDLLMVVDANLASLKTDPAVKRLINYRVRQNDQGKLVAQATVTYNHTGSFDWKTTRYRTYARLYAPLGSQLIRVDGALLNDKILNPNLKPGVPDVGSELGLTTFGAFTSIEPGTTGTLTFTYYLPDSIAQAVKNGTYQLMVDKQPGAQNNALTLDVDFGKPLTSASPSEDPAQFGDSKYLLNTFIDQDQSFVIRF